MECFSLNSGSNGNCIYVESGGVGVLLDAGISGVRTAERLAERGRDVRDVAAVIISHDHRDHVACAGILSRKFKLPVYMTRRTYRAAGAASSLGQIADLNFFAPGATLRFGPLAVKAHATAHDAAEPVAFVVQAGRRRVGILTDLGCVFDRLPRLIGTLDAVFLESNYDPAMLAAGPYPAAVKRRIAGDGGHISNAEAAELIAQAADGRCQWVALSHLSQVNNSPALALRTHRRIAGRRRPVHVAGRHAPGRCLQVH